MKNAVQQAIELAIEGGYGNGEKPYSTSQSGMFIDPLFWQSLGKSLGWGSFYDKQGMPRTYDVRDWHPDTSETKSSGTDGKMWQAHWHRFIDHLAEGKDAESFFDPLIKNNE